jgi:methylmalonyl-CoA/ethylmalonyl-CoA epimerase
VRVNRIDHICIAVKDLASATKTWAPLLGKGKPDEIYVDEIERVRVHRYMVGEVGVEVMESTGADSHVERWIERHGEGLMILGLNVDDTPAAMAELKAAGYPLIGGVRDCEHGLFGFVHPKGANGVLLELMAEHPTA